MARLDPHTVKFLSIEGGSAAGLTVHPGAVRALDERGILQYQGPVQTGVEAFVGSSSGSVLATLMSCGYRHDEIADLVHPAAFDLIFRIEDIKLGQFSVIGGCRENATPEHSSTLEDEEAGPVSAFIRYLDPLGRLLEKPEDVRAYIELKLNDSLSPKRIMRAALRRRVLRMADIPSWFDDDDDEPSHAYEVVREIIIHEIQDRISKAALNWGREQILEFVEAEYPKVVHKVLASVLAKSGQPDSDIFNVMRLDYGVFSGCVWRDYMDHAIALAAFRIENAAQFPDVRPPGPDDFAKAKSLDELFLGKIAEAIKRSKRGWTRRQRRAFSKRKLLNSYNANRSCDFEQHKRIFCKSLGEDAAPPLNIVGANISTQESHVFSVRDTGYLPVSDAVRISTCLPPAFKPVIIDAAAVRQHGWPAGQLDRFGDRHFLEGMWVDGGLYYNSPVDLFREFESDERRTLGLGMGMDDQRVDIGNVSEFYLSLMNVVYERNISATRSDLNYFINYKNFDLQLHSEKQTPKQIEFYQNDAYGRTLGRIAPPIPGDADLTRPSFAVD